MNIKNFNFKVYSNLKKLKNNILFDISKIINLNKLKILEINYKYGTLSNLIYKKYKKSYIYDIDAIKNYNSNNIENTYDIVFLFFSLQELVKTENIYNVIKFLYKKILTNGYLIIIDDFIFDWNNVINEIDFDIYLNKEYEYKDENSISKIKIIIFHKKETIVNKLNNIKKELCLYYSKTIIEENIKYYIDLKIKNLEFAFPIKTFPNNTILELFSKYNFHYDVSHIKEYELVKNFSSKLFFSDPTEKLSNKNSIRLNILGLNSHFGKEYDNRSYEIYHIHISLSKDKKVIKKIYNQIKKLNFSKTKYLDIGGSYENLSYFELYSFLQNIRNLIPLKVKIILEAGSLWFRQSGYLINKIENINEIRGIKYAFLNSSRNLHAKWSIPKYINNSIGLSEYILCGSSCDEKDLFEHIYKANLKKGQKIYFKNIEPYSYSFNSSFNGIPKAEVIIDE